VNIVLLFQKFVSVPIARSLSTGLVGPVEELDKSNAFLDQPPCQDAISGKFRFEFIPGVIGSVHFENVSWLGRQITNLGNA